MTTPKTTKVRKRRNSNTFAPRKGTLAAFVMTRPANEPPVETAKLAADAGLRNKQGKPVTAQAVYNIRWYYGASAATKTDVQAAAARIGAVRGAAVGGVAVDPIDAPSDLIISITRHGTDAARRVIDSIERRGQALGADILNAVSAGGA